MATYQGHKNWNHWNVSLWLSNDEGLYMLVRDALANNSRRDAASQVLATLTDMEMTHTPDGAAYTVTNILAALRTL